MNVEQVLLDRQVPYVRLVHQPAFTSQELAAREHVPGMKVAKPVLVRADDEYILCVLPATTHVDLDRIARLSGHRRVALAREAELAEVFDDCELGAEPPFGEPYGVPTWMDATLQADDYVVFQAGTHNHAVKIARTDYERLARPRIADFARA